MVQIAPPTLPVLAVTGLAREARLAAGPDITTIWAGGDPTRLRAMLSAQMHPKWRAVVSIGIAGGLDPVLVPGDVIVATGVAAPDRRYQVSPDLACRLATRLVNYPKLVVLANLAGVDAAVTSPAAKLALRRATGALAVDMESHVAAAFAAAHRLPFAAVRVVCDPADRSLPHLVAKALRPDGEIDLLGVVGGLIRRPTQVAALTRVAGDFAEGLRALRRCRELLGLGLGFGIPAHGDLVGELYARAAKPHRGAAALADSHCVVSTRALSIGRDS
jgi:hopanoid-associated phosphorylase